MSTSRNIGVDVLRGLVAYVIVLIHTPIIGNDVARDFVFRLLPSGNATFAVLAGLYMVGSCEQKEQSRSCTISEGSSLIAQNRFFVSLTDARVWCELQDGWLWLKGRTRRILVPYLFWSTAYVLLNVILDIVQHKPLLWDFSRWTTWGDLVFRGSGSVQMWFLIALLYVQVAIYLLRFLMRVIQGDRYFLFLALLIACSGICLYPQMRGETFIRNLVFMFGYVALGISLSAIVPLMEMRRRLVLWGFGALIVASFYMMCAGMSNQLLSVIHIIGWVGAARLTNVMNLPQFISLPGIHSMGIYLVHMIVVSGGLLVFKFADIKVALWGSSVILALFFFLVSWGVVMVLSRLKIPGM